MIKPLFIFILLITFSGSSQSTLENILEKHLSSIKHNLEWELDQWFIAHPTYNLVSHSEFIIRLGEGNYDLIKTQLDKDVSIKYHTLKYIKDRSLFETELSFTYYDTDCDIQHKNLTFYFTYYGKINSGYKYLPPQACANADTTAPKISLESYESHLYASKKLINIKINDWFKDALLYKYQKVSSYEIEIPRKIKFIMHQDEFSPFDHKTVNDSPIYCIKVKCKSQARLLNSRKRIRFLLFYITPNLDIIEVLPSDK